MGVRTSDLDKFDDLMALIDTWVTQAEGVGVQLRVIQVQMGLGQDGSVNEISYNADALPNPYWVIN